MLPAFADKTNPNRYGTGSRCNRWTRRTSTGVNIRQMVSFMKSAESSPLEAITSASSPR
jgi:hypothetical protein